MSIHAFLVNHQLAEAIPSPLRQAMTSVVLGPCEYLLSQGEPANCLYFLVDGKVEVEHFDEQGGRAVFSFEQAFSIIGELELFLDAVPTRFASIKTLTSCTFLALPHAAIKQYGMPHPPFLLLLCQALTQKLAASARLHASTFHSARVKVSKYLQYLSLAQKEVITLENRESIAAMLGMSVRQLNRALNQLADDGVITFKTKSVHVLDGVKLANAAQAE